MNSTSDTSPGRLPRTRAYMVGHRAGMSQRSIVAIDPRQPRTGSPLTTAVLRYSHQENWPPRYGTPPAPTPEFRARNVAVHRLSDRGAVVTTASHGTSPQGFEAEWKVIQILTVDGELISRCELFDETDLEAAITRFDELSRPTTRLENNASRAAERLRALFAARDWRAIAELYADDISADDRRRVIGGGPRSGRDAEVANLRAMADLGASQMDSTVLATRGTQLVLHRTHAAQDDSRFEASFLSVTEINTDGQIVRVVGFDVDEIDAAIRRPRRPISRRRRGRMREYLVSTHAGLCRREQARTTRDHSGLGDHRSPAS